MKRKVFSAISWLGKHWRSLLTAIIIAAIAGFTLSLQLSGLVPGQNQYETSTLANAQQIPIPWHRSVNAPYMLGAYFVGKVVHNPLYGARLTSVIFGLLATFCFFYIIKFWFSSRVAIVGSLMFITNGWLLNISHQAAPFSLMVFGPLLALLTLIWWLRTKEHKSMAFYLFAFSLAFAAYVPYTPWVMLLALVILLLRGKQKLLIMPRWQITIGAAIYLLFLAPLFAGLASHPGQILELLGIPKHLPSLSLYAHQFVGSVSMIAFHSTPFPELHLKNLPILDIFSVAMFLMGIYHFIKFLPRRRSLIYLSSFVLLLLILPLTPNYQLAAGVLLPLLYVGIVAGIVEMLNRWFAYFPRNPLARNIGVAIIVAAIGFSSYYNLQSYFIAWPNSAQTKSAYVVKSKE